MKKREIGVREIVTKNARETKKVAALLAEEILKKKLSGSHALVIGLVGELGSGKTTFAQGFAKGLGIKESVLSPTFVLIKHYALKKLFKTFIHVDCYRLDDPKELVPLGWHDLVTNPENLILIEWADRVTSILPSRLVTLFFRYLDETTRIIAIAEAKKA